MNGQESNASVIARMATLAGQHCPGVDVESFFDEVFGWRIGDVRIPDPEMASRNGADVAKRSVAVQKFLRDVEDYWFHLYKPVSGDVIVDIGAGRGEDVFGFSKAVGPSGRVWALEPHPVSFQALRKLCQWNVLDNVELFQIASTARPGLLQIETMEVWESNYVHSGPASASSQEVEGMPFDTLAEREGIGEISFLKMNIEGAERDALPGCREILSRTKNVCIAAHDFRADRGEGEGFRTLAMVRAFLRERGFELTTRDGDPRYYVPCHVHGVRR